MTVYRTDPETGKRYAFGGLIGNRTIDDRRSERDAWDKLLETRAPELTHNRPPLTLRQQDRNEWLLGWRASDETGTIVCPECGAENLPDSGFCAMCGEPLVAVEGEQPTQPGETVKCPQCSHMNAPKNNYCVACGEPMPLSTASASSRPRRALRRGVTPDGRGTRDIRRHRSSNPSSRAREGRPDKDRGRLLVAQDPSVRVSVRRLGLPGNGSQSDGSARPPYIRRVP